MRKLLCSFTFLVGAFFAYGQAVPTTTNLGLGKPPYHYPRWDITNNANWDILDGLWTPVSTGCGGDGSHAIGWNPVTHFTCISIVGTSAPGGSTGQLQYNNAGALGGFNDGTLHQVLHGTRVFGPVTSLDADSSLAQTGACTNQVVTALTNGSGPTCTTLTSAYVNTSIAQTGVDINTSFQVTALHLTGPALCGAGNYARGIDTAGNATGCAVGLVATPSVAQTIQPSADVTGLTVKQSNTANTADIFGVQDKSGSKRLQATADGNLAIINLGGATPGIGHFTTLDATNGITALSDGVHAGIDSLIGNTTAPAIPGNSAGFIGPNSAAFTSYFLQFPTTAPTANQAMILGAPVSNVVPVTFSNTWLIRSVQAPAGDTVNCPNNTTANFATTAFTIPANELVAGKIFRVTLEFTLLTSAAPVNMGLNLLIGGVQVVTPLAVAAASASIASRPVGMSYLIQGTAAAGASVNVLTSPIWGGVAGTTVIVPFAISTITPPVALATNGTLAILPQLFCSANTAGNGMTLQQVLVESN